MMAECPMGHTENLSFEELLERLKNNDFECREDGCSKHLTYPVDRTFWREYLAPFMHGEMAENVEFDGPGLAPGEAIAQGWSQEE